MWLSLLFIQHLLSTYCVPGPTPDVMEAAVNKADKALLPWNLCSLPFQREVYPGQGFFISSSETSHWEEIPRGIGSVFTLMAQARGDAQRLGVSWGSVGKTLLWFRDRLTEALKAPSRARSSQNVPPQGRGSPCGWLRGCPIEAAKALIKSFLTRTLDRSSTRTRGPGVPCATHRPTPAVRSARRASMPSASGRTTSGNASWAEGAPWMFGLLWDVYS